MSVDAYTVYIAGPMTGVDDDGFPAFCRAAERARSLGHRVFNPADYGHLTDTYTYEDAMLRDIGLLLLADAIALLPGWAGSRGARTECRVALATGKAILDAETFAPMTVDLTL